MTARSNGRANLLQLSLALFVSSALPAWGQGLPPGFGPGRGLPPGSGGGAGGRGGASPFGSGEDLVNLGALGLGVEEAGQALSVRKVLDQSPAGVAGVRMGDEIVGVAGQALQAQQGRSPGPAAQVVQAVERAEASRKRPAVVLTVRRGGEETEITVRLGKLGKHSRSCPSKCKKCEKVVRSGLEFMARTQAPDGSFPTDLGGKTGKVVVTSLCGLAFLSAGASTDPDAPLGRALNYVMSHVGQADSSPLGGMGGGGRGNWNQINWELGYGLMFLAEMAHKTRRSDVKAKCAELVRIIETNQEASGGWAHGPGGPNALGYLELEIVGNYLLTGLGAARRLELEVDEEKIGEALSWIVGTSPGDGGVGYSQRDGQRHGDPGRTAGALVAFNALGQKRHPFYDLMAGYFRNNMGNLPAGHVSPAMHLLAGGMAARVLGPQAWKGYMDAFRLHIMQHRLPDGSFAPTPTQESRSMGNNTDRTVGPRWTTATYVLILSLHNERLPLLLGGKDKKSKKRGRRQPRGRVRTGDTQG